jgi:predicted nucleic acid-binding protein
LIDERQGRLTAEAMGVAVVGSIGILIAAKVRGDVETLAPLLLALRASGLWMSDALIGRVLASVGEASGR